MANVPTPTDNWRQRVTNPMFYTGRHRDPSRQAIWVGRYDYVPLHEQPPAGFVDAGKRVFPPGRLPVVHFDDEAVRDGR